MSRTAQNVVIFAMISILISFLIIGAVCASGFVSLVVYHQADRPDHYVDGTWFTIGAIVFWSVAWPLYIIGGHRRFERKKQAFERTQAAAL